MKKTLKIYKKTNLLRISKKKKIEDKIKVRVVYKTIKFTRFLSFCSKLILFKYDV